MKTTLKFLALVFVAICVAFGLDAAPGNLAIETANVGFGAAAVASTQFEAIYNKLEPKVRAAGLNHQLTTLRMLQPMTTTQNNYKFTLATINNSALLDTESKLIADDAFCITHIKVGFLYVGASGKIANSATVTSSTASLAAVPAAVRNAIYNGLMNLRVNNVPMIEDMPLNRFNILQADPATGAEFGDYIDSSYQPILPGRYTLGKNNPAIEIAVGQNGSLASLDGTGTTYLVVECFGIKIIGGASNQDFLDSVGLKG